jgi:psp operon transcriptional activator
MAVDAVTFDPFASPWQPMGQAPLATAPQQDGESPNTAPPEPTPTTQPVSDLRGAVEAYEKAILAETMARCRYNQKIAAEALGLSYNQIRHALKKHGLNN